METGGCGLRTRGASELNRLRRTCGVFGEAFVGLYSQCMYKERFLREAMYHE